MKVTNVSTLAGCADSEHVGVTTSYAFDNGDVLVVEVIPEADTVWVQYNTRDGDALTPGDGHKYNLNGEVK